MPFFRKPLRNFVMNKKSTLQVRIFLKLYGFYEKRVLLSVSFNRRHEYSPHIGSQWSASLTVEAAFILPLFLFTMVLLMMPMKIMNDNRRIQTKLESVGEELTQYSYIAYSLKKNDRVTVPEELDQWKLPDSHAEAAAYLLYADIAMRSFVKDMAIDHISFLDSRILEDGETIDLVMNYRCRLPFPVLRIDSIAMTVKSSRRCWIGKDGGKGEGGIGEGDDQIVYVGRDSTRYHLSRTCHYLYNQLTSVSAGQVDSLRNQYGSRYHACTRCAKSVTGGSIYIMPSGESYHADRNCTAIIAYVRAVHLSEAAYLGPCSYCSHP